MLVPGDYFPDDLDTTSLATMVLKPHRETVSSVLDEMLGYLNPDGSFQVSLSFTGSPWFLSDAAGQKGYDLLMCRGLQTYFDRKKPRTDIVVSANILTCFCTFGCGTELPLTLRLVQNCISDGSFMHGTHYYPSADCCLFFFGRLLHSLNDAASKATLEPLLRQKVQEQIGKTGSALELAMRILTCKALHLECSIDRRALLGLQCEDGGWQTGWLYKYGSTGVNISNRGVTTALALKAIGWP